VPESTTDTPVVTPLGNGRYLVETATGRRLAFAAVVDTATWVFLEGEVYVRDDHPVEGAASPTGGDNALLTSPMPATVVGVEVAPGQRVVDGEILVRLEAMKMELPIVAPRDGVVASVSCRVGDLVQPGVPLVILETL
jgi:biotin carboxyl carrier protein